MKWYLIAHLPIPLPRQMTLQKSMQVFFLLLLQRHTFLESNQTCVASQIWKVDHVQTQSMRNKYWDLEYQRISFSDWVFVKSYHLYCRQAFIHLLRLSLVCKLVPGQLYQSRFVLDWSVFQLLTYESCAAMNWCLKQGYTNQVQVGCEKFYPYVLKSDSM